MCLTNCVIFLLVFRVSREQMIKAKTISTRRGRCSKVHALYVCTQFTISQENPRTPNTRLQTCKAHMHTSEDYVAEDDTRKSTQAHAPTSTRSHNITHAHAHKQTIAFTHAHIRFILMHLLFCAFFSSYLYVN